MNHLTDPDYLASRTAICQTALENGLTDVFADGWSSDERMAMHDDYWGRIILEMVEQNLNEDLSFTDLWDRTVIHEILHGSGAGKKLMRRKRHWLAAFSRTGRITDENQLTSISFFDFQYKGAVEQISLRVMNLLRRQIIRELFDNGDVQNSAIFDLGSGWGRHALCFARDFPHASVHAGEISKSGREVTRLISERFGFFVDSFAFNYLDWQPLVKRIRDCRKDKIVIFSSHSVEQVTYVDPAMWEQIVDLDKSITFIHLEPVGWQLVDNAQSPFSRVPDPNLGPYGGYNKNLVYIVQQLLNKKKITKLTITRDFVAFHKRHNSGTLISFCNKK